MKKETKKYNCVVYIHKRNIDGMVFYVGISTNLDRPYQNKRRGKFWMDYTKKYDYTVDIIKTDLSWDDACIMEQYLIKKYGRRDLGEGTLVNMTDGGDGTVGYKDTPQRVEEKRQWMLIHNPMDNPESRKLVSLSKLGKPRPDLGEINKTKEHIEKAHIGYMKFLETPDGEQYKKNMSELYTGDNNPMKKPAARIKNSESNKKFQQSLTKEERQNRMDNGCHKRVVCEFCSIETNTGNYARWHGNNCKRKK